MILLSTKPSDIQETFFQSFPPKRDGEILCPGGTGARLEELIQSLKVPKEDLTTLEIHQLLMSKIIDRLKYVVDSEYQVHLLPYLNFAFGLESKEDVKKRDVTFTIPQFDIPAYVLQEELTNYAENFKTEIQRRIDYLREAIDAICQDFDANIIYNPSQTERSAEMTQKFKSLGISSSEFAGLIKEKEKSQDILLDEDEDGFEWNLEAIDALVKKDLLLQLMSRNPEKTYTPSQTMSDNIPRGSNLFREDAAAKIAELLRSNNEEDLLIGVESLWTLGVRLAGNSPIQLIKTINLLSVSFLQKNVKPHLPYSR